MVKTQSYQLFKKIRHQLNEHFSEEAETLSFLIIEHFSGFNKTDIITDKVFTTGPQFETQIDSIIQKLINEEPIQYVLGKANFYDRDFTVNEHTLIPRQETEELVHLILQDIKYKANLSILDIGTGTGCIPITLKLEARSIKAEGIDISKEALNIASANAKELNAEISFNRLDILTENLNETYDIIISNPPYVLNSEKELMKANVLNNEPHQALFVADNTPLLFYNRITELACKHLKKSGQLYFEINEKFGNEVVKLMQSHSFTEVVLHQDLNGKDRFVSGKLV